MASGNQEKVSVAGEAVEKAGGMPTGTSTQW